MSSQPRRSHEPARSDGRGPRLVGSVIAIRRPENPVGWRLIDLGIGFTLSYEVDLGRLRAELVTTAIDAVRPTDAGLWLRGAREAT